MVGDYIRSVNVSNIEYIAFSIETTSIGVIRLQISVNVTTSENNIETLLNIFMGTREEAGRRENHLDKTTHVQWFDFITSQVSIGFSPRLSLSATCFGIIWYNSSSVLRISSSNFRIDSSSFFDFCCSWSSASFNSTDCWVPANIKSLSTERQKVIFVIETSFKWRFKYVFLYSTRVANICNWFHIWSARVSVVAMKQTTLPFIKISSNKSEFNWMARRFNIIVIMRFN